MLYECTINQAENDKRYYVEAGSYGEAENRFTDYARQHIAGEYELTSINRTHSNHSIASEIKVVNAPDNTTESDGKRRIGFNAVNLNRIIMEPQHNFNDRANLTINF